MDNGPRKIDDIVKNETAEHHLRQPIIKKG